MGRMLAMARDVAEALYEAEGTKVCACARARARALVIIFRECTTSAQV